MHDPKREERRRRLLKERKAAERRELDLDEADYWHTRAREEYRRGDVPAAARSAKKALLLNERHSPALDLLGHIYFEAGQFADAAYYLGLLRRDPKAVYASFNLAVAHMKLGRTAEAIKDFEDFLEKTKRPREPHWVTLRENARAWCRQLMQEAPAAAAGVPVAKRPAAPVAPAAPPVSPAPEPMPEPPRVAIDFLSAPSPDFSRGAKGTLADYFLLRSLLELKRAQSFDDLICLPSLHGVDTYHYQQESVRRVLRQFKGRALLADEVGLGKTIEACLVLKEYWARGMARKALVLTPPSLVSQWKGELVEKFGLSPASPDGPEYRSDPGRFWQEQPLIVASIAQARLEPHASALAANAWDMVIVDEAHCLKNRTSANWKLVNSLNKKFILMLTATPVENNLIELYNLITVLKPGLLSTDAEFRKQFIAPGKPKSPRNADRLRSLLSEVMVRNTRSVVDVRLPPRIAASVVAPPSPQEEQLYRLVSDFVSRRYSAAGRRAAAFGLQFLQRQAGSSVHALRQAVARALAEELSARPRAARIRRSGSLNLFDDAPPSEDLWAEASDRRGLEEIQELASQVLYSGKALQLGGMLAGRPGKTVVFTEFTATLDHLAEICAQNSVRYVLFRGDMSRPEKDAAIRRFRDEADVLLSTGSGGEGRNLQFADTVINFDLPWNPMRLEQRVGRVHRIGQTREVFVFNFCQAGTIEEHLLRVLHDKINMFELVVGEMDTILGMLDEERDFSSLVLDLWVSARESGNVGQAFDGLAERLIEAKKQYAAAKRLDDSLFQRDFEV